MRLLKTNNLEKSTKKTMDERIISSVFMAIYIVIIFVLAILSDTRWVNVIQIKFKLIPAILLITLTIPLIFCISQEINNIYFKFNKVTFTSLFINFLLLILVPTFIYLLVNYKYVEIKITGNEISFISGLQLTNIFAITLSCFIVVSIINLFFLLFFNYALNFKNFCILLLLFFIASGFFLGFYFVVFNRSWTTLLYLLLITIGMDSFAYFGGVFFGKHKMAPKISPKKTWEGFFIGLTTTMIFIFILLIGFSFIENKDTLLNIFGVVFKNPKLPASATNTFEANYKWWISMFFINLSFCIISVLGDLCFSWFKRKYRIKDFGSLIKGHGGVLDRIDSHAFVLSAFFGFSFVVALIAKTVVLFGI